MEDKLDEKTAKIGEAGKDKTAAEKAVQATKKNEDTFEKSDSSTSVTYKKNQLTGKQVAQLAADAQQRADNMRNMISSMIVKQGQKSNLTLFGQKLFVTKEQSDAAAASIAPGGEYSVDKVAGRIMDMAKALSGGDESKIDLLQKAVEKGFKAAGVELGGKLPSISKDTYDEVMKRFQDWRDESGKNAGAVASDDE